MFSTLVKQLSQAVEPVLVLSSTFNNECDALEREKNESPFPWVLKLHLDTDWRVRKQSHA